LLHKQTMNGSAAAANVSEIARRIFSGPVKQAGAFTIDLDLDKCLAASASQAERNQLTAEILMQLLLDGTQILFETAEPQSLTDEQLTLLSQYVRSYGYELGVQSEALTEPPEVSETPRLALKEHKERFYNFDEKMWKEFFFEERPGE
jgi:hypothetical protein